MKQDEGNKAEDWTRSSWSNIRCAMHFFTALSQGKEWNLHHVTSQMLRLILAHLMLGNGKPSWFGTGVGEGLAGFISVALPGKVGASCRRREAAGKKRHLLWSQPCSACCHCSPQPKQNFCTPRAAPAQLCYCAINILLSWYSRFSVTTAPVESVKSNNALAWAEAAYKVFLYAPCSESGNVLVCYSQRQNSQVGRQKSIPSDWYKAAQG